MERTIRELNGESCMPLEEAPPPKKQIYCTRSFGQRVHTLPELQQAACLHASRAAEKLRAQDSLAITLHVLINTSHHASDTYFNSKTVKLDYPTNDTRMIEALVKKAVASLYKDGYSYAKAGVGIVELQDRCHKQNDLFTPGQCLKSEALMMCMDNINARYGRNTTHVAAQGLGGRCVMSQKLLSPAYTTRRKDIPEVVC